MKGQLDGQVAIVTGAGQGIGRAIAIELASRGATVAVADRDAQTADRTARELGAAGRRVRAITADMTRRPDRAALAGRTMDAFGRIDILINNAGIHRTALPLDVTEEHWDALMEVNARATFFCTQAVLPHMIAARRGNVVNVASMAGKVTAKTSVPYAASKAAVIALTRGLALAYAADGIRVNCVCPGYVDTEMSARTHVAVPRLLNVAPDAYLRQVTDRIPLGRPARPDEVANVVAFLVSSDSTYMTGQALNVTGGLLMH
jgi:NAD(P)-dependent dehydrogenase (short-subunit alcohol dehydrogenase family)